MSLRDKIQQAAKRTDAATLVGAVAAVKRGDRSGFIPITGAMIWAGYSCPDAIEAVYDNIATAWLGSGSAPEVPTGLAEAPLEDSFWEAFWEVVQGPPEGYDAYTVTVAVAALGEKVWTAISKGIIKTINDEGLVEVKGGGSYGGEMAKIK